MNHVICIICAVLRTAQNLYALIALVSNFLHCAVPRSAAQYCAQCECRLRITYAQHFITIVSWSLTNRCRFNLIPPNSRMSAAAAARNVVVSVRTDCLPRDTHTLSLSEQTKRKLITRRLLPFSALAALYMRPKCAYRIRLGEKSLKHRSVCRSEKSD